MTSRKPIILALLIAVIPSPIIAEEEGFEPYSPQSDRLRRTIREVGEAQTFRPPAALERRVSEALRSIRELESQTDPRLASLLSSRLRAAWNELERSRAVGVLGYAEFDDETFQAASAKFDEVVSQFLGARSPYPRERYNAALHALSEVQALSRDARRAVPGLSSDDVLMMRDKRQKLLFKEPREDGGGERGPSR